MVERHTLLAVKAYLSPDNYTRLQPLWDIANMRQVDNEEDAQAIITDDISKISSNLENINSGRFKILYIGDQKLPEDLKLEGVHQFPQNNGGLGEAISDQVQEIISQGNLEQILVIRRRNDQDFTERLRELALRKYKLHLEIIQEEDIPSARSLLRNGTNIPNIILDLRQYSSGMPQTELEKLLTEIDQLKEHHPGTDTGRFFYPIVNPRLSPEPREKILVAAGQPPTLGALKSIRDGDLEAMIQCIARNIRHRNRQHAEPKKHDNSVILMSGACAVGKSSTADAAINMFASRGIPASLHRTYYRRSPREGEIPGTHGHFITSDDEWERLVDNKKIHLEFERSGNKYGIGDISADLTRGIVILICSNPQAVSEMKRKYKQSIVTIQLTAQEETLRSRLTERLTNPIDIQRRMSEIKLELEELYENRHLYDILLRSQQVVLSQQAQSDNGSITKVAKRLSDIALYFRDLKGTRPSDPQAILTQYETTLIKRILGTTFEDASEKFQSGGIINPSKSDVEAFISHNYEAAIYGDMLKKMRFVSALKSPGRYNIFICSRNSSGKLMRRDEKAVINDFLSHQLGIDSIDRLDIVTMGRILPFAGVKGEEDTQLDHLITAYSLSDTDQSYSELSLTDVPQSNHITVNFADCTNRKLNIKPMTPEEISEARYNINNFVR